MENQQERTDECDDADSDSTGWKIGEFWYYVMAGEIALVKKRFSGFVLEPNIFAFTPSEPIQLAKTLGDESRARAHIVSTPCTSSTSKGLKISDGYLAYTYKKFSRMYVDVTGSYQGYLDSFRKKTLSGITRKVRKVEKSNDTKPTIRTFKLASEVEEFVNIAKPISAVSYQEVLLGTEFRTDDVWIKKLQALAASGHFRGYVLYAEDKPVAYNYCPLYGDGVMLYDLSGYLQDYSRYSPGTVLQFLIVQEAFSEPSVKKYDLCQGEGRHKVQIATDSIECCNAYILPKNLYYLALVGLHFVIENSADKTVAMLDRIGLKDRIKKFVRQRSVGASASSDS